MKKQMVAMVLSGMVALPCLTQADSPIMLNLPKTGAPETRIGGGTRGADKSAISLQTLAPAQIGLTTQASPTLYWHISNTSNHPIEFSLEVDGSGEIVAEKTLPPASKAGIQPIALADLGIQLENGKDYRWTVALVTDNEQRAKDVIASAAIRKTDASVSTSDIKQLAQAGIWYDLVQRLVEQKSGQLAQVLKQVDIVLNP